MNFRIRQIDHTADGREILRERDVAAAELVIGRAAESDIHLPDLAVEAQHAKLVLGDELRLSVTALGNMGFIHDGAITKAASINCRNGGELRFGSYSITIGSTEDGAALLTIRKADAQDHGGDDKRGFSLAGALPGKRVMAWALALIVLGAFLALPIWSSLHTKRNVVGDKAWSSGPLSVAHKGLGDRCEACHVRPFEAVQDQTCKSCHKTIDDHAAPPRTAQARAPLGLGESLLAKTAHQFGKPGAGACTDCHTEHEGAGKMPPPSQQFCADCHGTLDRRLTDTKLGNAVDFGTQHPQFRPQIAAQLGSRALRRVSLDNPPKEANGLTFSHQQHLDRLGGVARMFGSLGGKSAMQCSNCHRPTEDGVRFQPVKMERDCESCHSLAYDKVGGTVRTLRHGDVGQMQADLLARDRSVPIVTQRRRPGEFDSGGLYASSFPPPVSGPARIGQALSQNGVCGECHTPVMGRSGMTVQPVTQVSRFMLNGWFDHKPHVQEKCSTCHLADKSQTSADLLLPDVKQCRSCHLGEAARAPKVPSSCAMCHSYHLGVPESPNRRK